MSVLKISGGLEICASVVISLKLIHLWNNLFACNHSVAKSKCVQPTLISIGQIMKLTQW